jgi:serine/threonine protein kinase
MRLVILANIVSSGLCIPQGQGGYEGFPIPGETIVPVGPFKYRIEEFLGAGPKKRAYTARRVPSNAVILPDQQYMPPKEHGMHDPGYEVPNEVVIKCSATDQEKRKGKLEHEFHALLSLNPIKSVRKPVVLYLSKRWDCFDEPGYVCQYLVMTKASSDLKKIIERNEAELRAPVVNGVAPLRTDGKYSFELFMATFALSLMSELEKLHAVGLFHRDMSIKNVALDPKDKTKVFIIDLGSSKNALTCNSVDSVERRAAADFARVKRVTVQLISIAVRHAYPPDTDPLQSDLCKTVADSASKWDLRIRLLNYLKEEFPRQIFDERVLYG